MQNIFAEFINGVEKLFTKSKTSEVVKKIEAGLASVAHVIPFAITVVEDIAAIAPNRTVQEAEAVLEKYIGPVAQQINADPASIGNILLNAATVGVMKALPPELRPTVSTIQTAIQLAVTANNAAK